MLSGSGASRRARDTCAGVDATVPPRAYSLSAHAHASRRPSFGAALRRCRLISGNKSATRRCPTLSFRGGEPREVHLAGANRQQQQQVTVLSEAQVPVVVEVRSQKDVRSSWCSSRSPETKPGLEL